MTATERPGLALVATLRKRLTDSPVETLTDPGALGAWLTSQGLTAGQCTEADLDATRTLREAIYEAVAAAATDRRPADAALGTLNTAAARSATQRKLLWDKKTGYHLAAGPETRNDVLAEIARDTVDLLTGPERARLHQCEADTCGTVFVTSGGGRPRRWCSSATCGNRERVRAYRNEKARA
ncbi:CGNR zinc finger domain-containing protein [Nocardia sp. NPDC088792]|uniref:CGNR zinc finger domain-containing protein n=1 Tax=Nocardia sp. NPDC088792 TaxID=3364332 RepID=UPI00381A57B6